MSFDGYSATVCCDLRLKKRITSLAIVVGATRWSARLLVWQVAVSTLDGVSLARVDC